MQGESKEHIQKAGNNQSDVCAVATHAHRVNETGHGRAWQNQGGQRWSTKKSRSWGDKNKHWLENLKGLVIEARSR